jgi:iron complex transport system substrate-binding protein
MRVLFIVFAFLLAACGRRNHGTAVERPHNEGNVITEAERFEIERYDSFSVVRILNPWQGTSNTNLVYYLVKRGHKPPAEADSSSVIYVPVNKVVCMSATHAAMIAALGKEESIKAVSGKDIIYSAAINELIVRGLVKDVGYEASLNNELIVEISPDLVMMYGIGGESAGYAGKLRQLGIKILFNADYLETDPLGKAEWIKLFGALYCSGPEADSIYLDEKNKYEDLRRFIANNIKSRPDILLGLPFKDTWYISPGNSYISKLIDDAGGNYLWRDVESSVSMPYSLESVYMKAGDADFWLNTGTASTKGEISAIDRRFTELPCYKNGNLFNNINRMTASGGNDYWESGTLYPHLILADMAEIFHPGILKNHVLYFYKQLL